MANPITTTITTALASARAYIYGGVAGLFLLAVSGCVFEHHQAERAETAKVAVHDQAVTSAAQNVVTSAASSRTEYAQRRAGAVIFQAQRSAHAIEQAPSASTPVPADVARSWAGAIDRLREHSTEDPFGGAHDPGGPGPEGPVPPS